MATNVVTGTDIYNDFTGGNTTFGDSRTPVAGPNVTGTDNNIQMRNGGDNLVYGDAERGSDGYTGGDDYIRGGFGTDRIIGDSAVLSNHSFGGNDKIFGGGGGDFLFGDARILIDSTGGNDLIHGDLFVGAPGNDTLWGDAYEMRGASKGGNDVLRADGGDDWLWGDAQVMSAASQGGNDILEGGAGNDTFGFAGKFGNDIILDFEVGEHLYLRGYGLTTSDIRTSAVSISAVGRNGADTLVTINHGELQGTILLKDTDAAAVDASYFLI